MARLPSRRSDKTRIRGYETANGQSQVVSASEQFFFGGDVNVGRSLPMYPFKVYFYLPCGCLCSELSHFKKTRMSIIVWMISDGSNHYDRGKTLLWVACRVKFGVREERDWVMARERTFFYGSQKLFQCFFFNKSVIKKTKHSKYKIKIAAFVIS